MQHISNIRLTQMSLSKVTVDIYRAYWSQVIFKNINKLERRQRILVITSAELCFAFGKKERERRRLRDYEGGNIRPSSVLLSHKRMARSLSLSTLSLSVFALWAHALVH